MAFLKGLLSGVLYLALVCGLWLAFGPELGSGPGQFSERLAPELTLAGEGDVEYQPPLLKFDTYRTEFQGEVRVWHGLGVEADFVAPGFARPAAIVLLHGPGRDGRAMLDMWQAVAIRDGVTLIAPDALARDRWDLANDGEAFLRHVLERAAGLYFFDPDRVYLFGDADGADFALTLADQGLGPWRAVAVHAGSLPVAAAPPVRGVAPIRFYLGASDPVVSQAAVREAAMRLAAEGHDTSLVIIPGHGHDFYAIGPGLALDIWRFFTGLAADQGG